MNVKKESSSKNVKSVNNSKKSPDNKSELKQTICYTGIGANKTGLHTDNEFRKLVKTQKLCNNNCPKKIDDWVEWYGAGRKSEKVCKNVVKLNKKIDIQNKKADKATENLKKCIKEKCDYAKEDVYISGVCVVKKCVKEGKKFNNANKLVNKASDKANRAWN